MEKHLDDLKVTVWCRFATPFVIGSSFFEEINRDTLQTVSVSGEQYAALLKNKVIHHFQERKALHSKTFMQDAALPHIAASVQDNLGVDIYREQYPESLFPL